MIFKTLFKKKKWLSEKVSERLAAVAELELTDSGNKAVFHELAFNDGDDKVRRATLDKLNDFSLWWQAFKNDPSDNIRRHAEKVIVEALVGERECKLDESLKKQFIAECNKTALLEKVVFKLNDDALTLDLIQRLNKPSLTLTAIQNETLPEATRLTLLQKFDDEGQLKKLQKRLSGQLLESVEAKLNVIVEAKAQPVRLEKQVRLLLAQLNALKEKHDFELINVKLEQYVADWDRYTSEFDCLEATLRKELEGKYEQILGQLDRITQPLKAAHEAEKEKLALLAEQRQNALDIENEITKVEASVASSIAAGSELNQESIGQQINAIVQSCNDKNLAEDNKTELLEKAESVFNRANQVPQIKAAIAGAIELIEQLNGLSVPSDAESYNAVSERFYEIRKQWKINLNQVGIALPEEIAQSYQTLSDKWFDAIKPIEKEQQQLFSQMRRKLTELLTLVEHGRYKSAFGLYKKLGFWYETLSENQRQQIERKWQNVQEQIASLQELQESISNPKRQEILEQIKQLAEQPLADAGEQAHRVRLLRSNWQSLGPVSEQNAELAQQFDSLSEQAFAPCREHYKVLEDERANNLKAKQLILQNLSTLVSNLKTEEVSNWRELESAFVKLTKLWRETGHIDRELVNDINEQYQSLVKPVRKAINDHHKENETAKKALIDKAEKIVSSSDDVAFLIEELKGLQQQWQKIGFAGKNQDQKLWSAFRAINNPVFAKRDDAKREANAAEKTYVEELSTQFDAVEKALLEANDLAAVRVQDESNSQVFESISDLSKPAFEKMRKRYQGLKKQIDIKLAELRSAQERQVYLDLFEAVSTLIEGGTADLSNLKSAWANAINNPGQRDREEITLQLEINEGVESTSGDKALRNQVQMNMLTAKMEQGVEFHKNDLLENWLAAGPFVAEDSDRLQRIKVLF